MRRLQLFELEDQDWLPGAIRNAITDFLQFAVTVSSLYRPFAARLARALAATGANRVIDLCSGAGGPWPQLRRDVDGVRQGAVRVVLTDWFPNLRAFERLRDETPSTFDFSAEPVSAMRVDERLAGFRTLFSSFHHFRPDEAARIVGDAVASGQGIAIAESTQRHPLLIGYMLVTPLLVLLTSPFQRPFRWSRLFWTYVVPVVPLAVMFDGIVSCLRTYTPEELLDLAASVPGADGYRWEAGVDRLGALPVGVTYLIGYPARPRETD